MTKEEASLIVELFQAIESDWALCDENDEDEHLVLVNEDREVHQTLKPLKLLVNKLEAESYILLDETRSDSRGKEREYMDFLDETIPVPFVYYYGITKKGKQLYAEFSNS